MDHPGYTAKDLVILVPMLGRPARVRPLLESIDATTPGARVLFILAVSDHATAREIDKFGREHVAIERRSYGDYARKINHGYDVTTEALMFLGADDLKFHPGWFEAALGHLAPGIGVVGTNDMGSPRVMEGRHSTHSLVTRNYVDEFGVIDHPGRVLCEEYSHEYVDDELVETAKYRNAWVSAVDSRVEHLHPFWGKAPMDHVYSQARRRMLGARGQSMFLNRRHLWT